jgi:hypothetical protein
MSLDVDTAAALLAVLASAAYLLRGALAAAARFLAQSRGGTGPRICKGCGGGGCKTSSTSGAARGVLVTEQGSRRGS